MEDKAWKTLLARIRSGRCTPFIGAGADAGVLPLGTEVAGNWAQEWDYPLDDRNNLTRVAQFLAVTNDPMIPKEMIADELGDVSPPDFDDPDEPHGVLADLGLSVYITTNYDDFMTKALESRGRTPQREVCRWNRYTREIDSGKQSVFEDPAFKPTPEKPVVFHLHGIREEPESMVLTEDDYLEFVVNLTRYPDLLPAAIQGAFAGASLLFIGYSLQDWTFKVLFKGLVGSLEDSTRRMNLAVQLKPDTEPAEDYLNDYFRDQDVGVYWGTATEFAKRIRAELGDKLPLRQAEASDAASDAGSDAPASADAAVEDTPADGAPPGPGDAPAQPDDSEPVDG